MTRESLSRARAKQHNRAVEARDALMSSLLVELKSALATTYPENRAAGYAEGDLRGWFWVELKP